jgi:hypothetical protein
MIDLRTPLDARHARNARLHALKRLRQRFGISLDMAGLASIEADLVAGRYRWISMERCRRTIVYEVPIGAVTTYPRFNVNLWAIVTFRQDVGRARPAVSAGSERA